MLGQETVLGQGTVLIRSLSPGEPLTKCLHCHDLVPDSSSSAPLSHLLVQGRFHPKAFLAALQPLGGIFDGRGSRQEEEAGHGAGKGSGSHFLFDWLAFLAGVAPQSLFHRDSRRVGRAAGPQALADQGLRPAGWRGGCKPLALTVP